jgi:hypothetical protein
MTPRNRFQALPPLQRALLLVAILATLGALSEVTVWAASVALFRVTGKWLVPQAMIEHFHPLFNKSFPGFASQEELENRYDPATIYWYLPNLRQDLAKRRRWATDRHGFVLNDPDDPAQAQRDLEQPKRRTRIFVFGGSTSLGSRSQTTVAAFLEEALNRQDPGRFECVMGGMSGWSSVNELMLVATKVMYLQPDLLVTFDGTNDAIHSVFARQYERNIHPRGVELGAFVDQEVHRTSSRVLKVNAYPLFDAIGMFYTPRAILRPLERFGFRWPSLTSERQRILERVFGYRHPGLEFHPEAVEVYLQNLESIGAIAATRGVRTVHVLQPTLAVELLRRGAAARPEEWAVMRQVGVRLDEFQLQRMAAAFGRFFAQARAGFLARRAGTQGGREAWLDYTDFFRDDDLAEVYYDYVHYTDERTRQLAESIARDVRKMLARGA